MTTVVELADVVRAGFERRESPVRGLLEQTGTLALACRDMGERFRHGGRLLVFGNGTGTTDAQHIAVEFVHPAIVGKRSLPALSLAGDAATLLGLAARWGLVEAYAQQVQVLGRPEDIALGLGDDDNVRRGLDAARARGMLTVALTGSRHGGLGVDHLLHVGSDDPHVVKEAHVTAYHLLWELVHVFLDSPSAPGAPNGVEQLYPFLYGGGSVAEDTLAATAESARQKVLEVVELRRTVGAAQVDALARCAQEVAGCVSAGGTVLAFGNGGSSTDAQDVVHTFMDPPPPARAVPALGLTNDVAVVTALSNDVSFDVVFARQVQAFGRANDVALALSTSGGSKNVLAALDLAHRMGLLTVGLAGYGGGRMAESASMDHLFAVPSSSVHRVQEVQTTLTHLLWEGVMHVLEAGQQPLRPGPG